MVAKEARAVQDHLRAFGDPYERTFERKAPTFNNPVEVKTTGHYVRIVPREVWIYNLTTGRVYARVAAK
jgi:hypothetical protein